MMHFESFVSFPHFLAETRSELWTLKRAVNSEPPLVTHRCVEYLCYLTHTRQ